MHHYLHVWLEGVQVSLNLGIYVSDICQFAILVKEYSFLKSTDFIGMKQMNMKQGLCI